MRYRWLRDVHLAVGAFAAPFVLLYALSALLMAHPRLAFTSPVKRQWETTIAAGLADPRAVAEALREEHDVRGDLTESRAEEGALHLRIVRPGRRYEIDVALPGGIVSVREEEASFSALMNRLHHLTGVWHREPAANAWGVAVVLVSTALLALVASGFWMWTARAKDRRAGLLVLGASLGFALGILASIRLA